MKRHFLSLALAAALALGAQSFAASDIVVLPNQPAPTLGVTTRLVTSGYSFVMGGAIKPTPGGPGTATPDWIAVGPTSFEASFAIVNHTANDIDFQVPVSPAANPVAGNIPAIIFSIYDSQNNVVWQSWTNPGDLPTGARVLKAGNALRMTKRIPLEVKQKSLNGDYTLVATVNGTPLFSSTAAFKVILAPSTGPSPVFPL